MGPDMEVGLPIRKLGQYHRHFSWVTEKQDLSYYRSRRDQWRPSEASGDNWICHYWHGAGINHFISPGLSAIRPGACSLGSVPSTEDLSWFYRMAKDMGVHLAHITLCFSKSYSMKLALHRTTWDATSISKPDANQVWINFMWTI